MARLARAQRRAGGWFTIENPEDSFLRLLSPVKALRALLGVASGGRSVRAGGLFRKPTGWPTNAKWMDVAERRCPPDHPKHDALVGFVTTRAELAAEYPEGLCDALAAQYVEASRVAAPMHQRAN
eukprot:7233994-Alexandrium_andersonii.AAC.1